jgi:hypothetical protein
MAAGIAGVAAPVVFVALVLQNDSMQTLGIMRKTLDAMLLPPVLEVKSPGQLNTWFSLNPQTPRMRSWK